MPYKLSTFSPREIPAIPERTTSRTSAPAIAANSVRLDSDTFVYQALFDSESWYGELKAFKIAEHTREVATVPTWEAGKLLTARSESRVIVTHDSTVPPEDPPGILFE